MYCILSGSHRQCAHRTGEAEQGHAQDLHKPRSQSNTELDALLLQLITIIKHLLQVGAYRAHLSTHSPLSTPMVTPMSRAINKCISDSMRLFSALGFARGLSWWVMAGPGT